MPIDRIGKSGAPPPVPAKESVSPVAPTKPFEVGRAEVAPPAPVAPTAPTPLERLKAGDIDVDQYVDLKVDQATAHLRGVPRAQMDAIRAMLREQVASDPALVDLVRAATGRAPTPRE
jgi:hypothetical protein